MSLLLCQLCPMTVGRIQHDNKVTMDKQVFAHRKSLLIAAIRMIAVILFLALIGCKPATLQTSSAPAASPSSTIAETQPQPEASMTPSAAPAAASSPCSDPQPAL